MKKAQVSPFAALTGQEKQLKWLEYQSVRLPYAEGSVDPSPLESPEKKTRKVEEAAEKKESKAPETSGDAPTLRYRNQVQTLNELDFQKPRHRQYDAVIARMKQAERQASRFQQLPQGAQKI